jgi:hypothetical protein
MGFHDAVQARTTAGSVRKASSGGVARGVRLITPGSLDTAGLLRVAPAE